MLVNNQTTTQPIPIILMAGQSLQVSPYNPSRNYYAIFNIGANAASWKWGSAVDTTTGVPVGPLSYFEWNNIVPDSSFNVFSTAGTRLVIYEGVRPARDSN